MERMKRAIKISALIAGLFGGMPAFAQSTLEVDFYAGQVYDMRGDCSGELIQSKKCFISLNNISNVRITLSQKGIDKCFFAGEIVNGTPAFAGTCLNGNYNITNSFINPNNPKTITVNVP